MLWDALACHLHGYIYIYIYIACAMYPAMPFRSTRLDALESFVLRICRVLPWLLREVYFVVPAPMAPCTVAPPLRANIVSLSLWARPPHYAHVAIGRQLSRSLAVLAHDLRVCDSQYIYVYGYIYIYIYILRCSHPYDATSHTVLTAFQLCT